MDAPPSSSERNPELATLQSRAYGPDADIHLDADALTRLVELEEMARSDAAASDPAPAPTAPAVAPSTIQAAEAAPTAAADLQAAVTAPEGSPPAAAPPTRRPRWRQRVPIWGWITGAALVGLTVGLVIPVVVAPQPDAVLRPIPLDGDSLEDHGFGFDPDSQVRFEPFYNLEVWSGQNAEGALCVVVLRGYSEWVAVGCGPEQLSPTADLTLSSMMLENDGPDLPDGSVVRFVLRDGVIDVWMVPMNEEA